MKQFYPDELLEQIKKFNYIPRKINKNEHLKLYHRYWIPELGGVIKVKEIWKENGTEYYIIKYKNDLFICFSYPLDDYFESYELLHDYSNIYKENIVNNEKSYTGAEIKYWFALNHDKKYDKFGKFLDSRSKHCLSDKLKYKVTIDKNNKYSIKII